jgi:hypothetical protein
MEIDTKDILEKILKSFLLELTEGMFMYEYDSTQPKGKKHSLVILKTIKSDSNFYYTVEGASKKEVLKKGIEFVLQTI